MYIELSMSLRNVEDLLVECDINTGRKTLRHWWNRFRPMFTGDIRRQRASAMRRLRDEAYSSVRAQDPNFAKKLKIEASLEASAKRLSTAREWHGSAKAQWDTIHSNDIIRSLERPVSPRFRRLPIGPLPPADPGVLRKVEARGAIEMTKRVG